jgi:hypothetical protein
MFASLPDRRTYDHLAETISLSAVSEETLAVQGLVNGHRFVQRLPELRR